MTSTPSHSERPNWLRDEKITIRFDARPILSAGGHPVADVLEKAGSLQTGEVLVLITPFPPAPLVEKVLALGFENYMETEQGLHYNYFCKPE